MAVRKFGLIFPVRQSHFFGQGAIESAFLSGMQEKSMIGKLKGDDFYGTKNNPLSQQSENDLGHWYGALVGEDDAWFRSTKYNSKGTKIAGTYMWKLGNCDPEDPQKFRGRGFKQLTGRSNYTEYWVFKGWLFKTSFSDHWWDDPAFKSHDRAGMKMQPAVIDDPHKVALPEYCIDAGAFYLRCLRPNVMQSIDEDTFAPAQSAAQVAKEKEISETVTVAINGGDLAKIERYEQTVKAKKVFL